MLEKFYSNNNDIFLKNGSGEISFSDFKTLVLNNLERVKNKKENVVISSDNILFFIVDFFVAVFAKKNIYLADEIVNLKNLNFDYDILTDCETNYSPSQEKLPEVDEKEIYVSLLTSGSSGTPKTIRNTLYNLVAEAQGIVDSTNLKKGDCIVATTTTCSHRYGFTYIILIPVLQDYIIYTDKLYYPDGVKFENCLLISTPSFLDIVKNNNLQFPVAPKCIISAGAKLKQETFEYLEQYQSVVDIYGATETGVSAYRKSSKDKELTLLNDVKMISADDGTIVLTPYAIEKEVKVSDLIDVNGNKITLKARTDRLLKIQEKRISAQSIEEFLRNNGFVDDCYCFKKDDKIACLCALSESGREFLLSEGINELKKFLKQFARKQFEIIPQKWKFIDKLPVTKRGKTDSVFIEHLFNLNFSFPVILESEKDENSAKFKLWLYPSSNYFNGHFPKYPVTPGVVQLYLASFIGSRVFECELSDGQMKRVKFSNIIKAGEVIDLILTRKKDNVEYEYRQGEKTFSSGVLSTQNILAEV